ncbi:50S ribosomal protein L18 [Mesomycoplasma conjunctivae]|uniref:Large ribosomal subunit protein uL18 n=1 Tax=Mesomycoplasma conjunctivae (strain ATCC 25834 / NCTC 10147 / HRC/581) TaxID=572263 RepID=C5J5U7_MESCH|nr:50S ribosomal protein L18 [Mesomycoplasma conjunctivae]CAT04836.1 50S ribosomal protein L18 [Mesomycoplasma conjunctivae]VEU65889.1 50S ribosomal protein L18 [Mesomycoplasma conjunctivae]
MALSRNQARKNKHARSIKKSTSSLSAATKYRIGVYKSLKHFYAYIFNPETKQVITSVTTLTNEKNSYGGNIAAAKSLAPQLAKKISELKLEDQNFIFDRSGYIYHGRVKAFAEELRNQGVKF